MPITPHLNGQAFDPETITMMSGALDLVCSHLGLKIDDMAHGDQATEMVAESIIRHVQRGVRTQAGLYLATMADFKQSDRKPH